MANVRGVDVIGQGFMQGMGGFWDNLASVLAEQRRQKEASGIMSDLQQGAQGLPERTYQAPVQKFVPGQSNAGQSMTDAEMGDFNVPAARPNPNNVAAFNSQKVQRNPFQGSNVAEQQTFTDEAVPGVPIFSEQNADKLGRLFKLSPERFKALESTLPKFQELTPGTTYGTTNRYGDFKAQGQTPNRPVGSSQGYLWLPESPDGSVQTQSIPGTNATQVWEYAVDPATKEYIPGPDGMPMRRLKSGGTMPMSGGGAGARDEIPMTPDAMDFAYQMFKTNGELPKSGMGIAGTISAWKFYDYAEKRARAEGIPAAEFAAQRAKFKSGQQALAGVQKIASGITPNINAARKNMGLVKEFLGSGYTPPTGVPLMNEFVQTGQTHVTGDPNLQKFKNLIYTAVREYAKVANGQALSIAGLPATAVEDAKALLNSAMNGEQILAALDAMDQDMRSIDEAWQRQAADLRTGMSTQAAPRPGGGGQPQSGGKKKFKIIKVTPK